MFALTYIKIYLWFVHIQVYKNKIHKNTGWEVLTVAQCFVCLWFYNFLIVSNKTFIIINYRHTKTKILFFTTAACVAENLKKILYIDAKNTQKLRTSISGPHKVLFHVGFDPTVLSAVVNGDRYEYGGHHFWILHQSEYKIV